MADVFVSASEHEGFGAPLAEAMGHGVPVVAYAAAAVPETLGQAGLLLPDKSPSLFAAAVGRVLADSALARAMSAAGRARVSEFDLAASQQAFVSLIRGATGLTS
jgi:glycosyltransferase involved in cell wall biosynthesis